MRTTVNIQFARIMLLGLSLLFLASCSSEKEGEEKTVSMAEPSSVSTADGRAGAAMTAPQDQGRQLYPLQKRASIPDELGDDAVSSADILDNTVTSADITDGTIALGNIGYRGVGTAEIVDGSMMLADRGDNAISSAETVGGDQPGSAVAGYMIVDNTVTAEDILDNTIEETAFVDDELSALPDSLSPAEALTAEEYHPIIENNFLSPVASPLSTFSIDVDAASYSNTRRYIEGGALPPVDAVRIEELVNYFNYDYPEPTGDDPFSIVTGTAACPWNERHRLVQVGLQGRHVPMENVPANNLVFLIDVSGSMDAPEKLPLLKDAFGLLVDQLREQDRVSIVVYAGNAGMVLPSTSGSRKGAIRAAIADLDAGGSTAGGAGIELAYNIARQNFRPDGNNRVILATDGDFNVGVSGEQELVELIERERNDGIFLSVLGFGMGNYMDSKMEQLADNGNGNYAYIDNEREARKVLVREFGGTLYTIAKDVKLQIEFNPKAVAAYRLIGYENRVLAARDFDDDRKDAGDMGAGHSVTALYEVVPVGSEDGLEIETPADSTRYRLDDMRPAAYGDADLMEVRLRYKQPKDTVSNLLGRVVRDDSQTLGQATDEFRFAAAVTEFGLLLRNSRYKGNASFDEVIRLAKSARGTDPNGDRAEFISLAEKAKYLSESVALGSVR